MIRDGNRVGAFDGRVVEQVRRQVEGQQKARREPPQALVVARLHVEGPVARDGHEAGGDDPLVEGQQRDADRIGPGEGRGRLAHEEGRARRAAQIGSLTALPAGRFEGEEGVKGGGRLRSTGDPEGEGAGLGQPPTLPLRLLASPGLEGVAEIGGPVEGAAQEGALEAGEAALLQADLAGKTAQGCGDRAVGVEVGKEDWR